MVEQNDQAPWVVRQYLGELERELDTVPPAMREELIAGIREELTGLDAAAASARIERLGDPVFIAAGAREGIIAAGTPDPVGRLASSEPAPPWWRRHDPAWYSVVTAILLLVGGFLGPIIGWFAGLAMLLASRTWRWTDKLLGALVLPGGLFGAYWFLSFPVPVALIGRSDAAPLPDGTVISTQPALLLLPSPWFEVAQWLIIGILAALPLFTFAHLLRRANRLREAVPRAS